MERVSVQREGASGLAFSSSRADRADTQQGVRASTGVTGLNPGFGLVACICGWGGQKTSYLGLGLGSGRSDCLQDSDFEAQD